MSQTHGDEFLSKLETSYHFLNGLSLSRDYSTFSLDRREKPYIYPHCYFFLTSNPHDTCNYSSLCTSAQSVLSQLHMMKILHRPINIAKKCEYLSYWIYDNIMKSISCIKNEEFYQKLNDTIIKNKSLHNICDIKNFKIGKEEFDKKKKLYLLGEMLNLVKEEYDNISNVLKPSYKQYFGECARIYNEIVSEDKCETNENYNSELTEFKKNFDAAKSFLNKKGLSITHDLTEYSESACPGKSQSVQIRARGESDKEAEARPAEKGVKERPAEQGRDARTEEQVEILKTEGAEVSEPERQQEEQAALTVESGPTTEIDMSQTAKENSFDGEGSIVAGINGDTPEPIVPKNASTIGATLAGSSLFLLMMYKYTPLGSWVSTKILRKDKLMDNMNKNNYELLLNEVGNREGSINDTMYNIRYNNISNR